MHDLKSHAGSHYSPLYFLAALGLGGASVTFFMFLMFWLPHPGQPVPVFEDIVAGFQTGGLPMQAAIIVAMAGRLLRRSVSKGLSLIRTRMARLQ